MLKQRPIGEEKSIWMNKLIVDSITIEAITFFNKNSKDSNDFNAHEYKDSSEYKADFNMHEYRDLAEHEYNATAHRLRRDRSRSNY